jgi:DNA-binding NtrC family response regulator
MARLQRYAWPGNIRELQNVIERAVITSRGPELGLDLPEEGGVPVQEKAKGLVVIEPVEERILTDAELRELERQNMLAALKASRGKLFGSDGAAARLGVKPTTLASRLKKMNIQFEG